MSPAWQWPFVVAIALLLGSGGLAVRQYSVFSHASGEVEHATRVLDVLQQLVGRLVDAETGFRGYLLAEDPRFLQPYDEVRSTTARHHDELTRLVADDPNQLRLARQLSLVVQEKLDDLALTLVALQGGRREAAMERFRDGAGRRAMDTIRAIAAEMREAERARLNQQALQAHLARRAALGFGVLSVVVALVLGLVAVVVHRGFERRRIEHEHEFAGRLEAEHTARAAAEHLRESESLTRSILGSTGDCISLIELDGRLISINEPGCRLMAIRDTSTVIGRSWADLWGAESVRASEALALAADSGEGRFHGVSPGEDGPRWWDVIVSPIRDDDGRIVRFVSIARDITEQKQAEEERTRLLANERAARSEAERAARLKDEFVSTLSHELRTPLNAIIGWIGVLNQDRRPETVEHGLAVIDRNARRQSQMVDDLLDVSRIMAGKLRLDVQPVDLAGIIDEALGSARPGAEAKGVHLEKRLGSGGLVQGDPGRLQQIVWNLVTNAVKFTPRDGTVQVTLGEADGHAELAVRDTGQGISPELLPHVFQRFRQGDSSPTRRHGGLGLGLAIVKNLVEMHGGSVAASSEGPGHGSVFVVRLPLATTAAAAAARPARAVEPVDADLPASGPLLSGVVALVLDDEPDARELVQRLLEDAGASVAATASAQEALTQISDGLVPHVIVSDIGLPDEDGYAFMRQVRHLGGAVARTPAAALTALVRVEDRKRALMAGYQAHLAKPVDPAELVAMVASLTGRTGGPRRA